MSRALAAGLPLEHLAILMAARRHWWAEQQGAAPAPPDPLTGGVAEVLWNDHLDAALEHPAAATFDEVFVAAMRRRRR